MSDNTSPKADLLGAGSESVGLKRKSVDAPIAIKKSHPSKKMKKSNKDSDDKSSTHPVEVVTGAAASGGLTRASKNMPSPPGAEPHSKQLPGDVDRATADERTRTRHSMEREEKLQDREAEARARQEIEEYEQARMEAAFAETMREHESIRRASQPSLDDLMHHQPTQTNPSIPREQPYLNFITSIPEPPQLDRFATKRSKRVMYNARVTKPQQCCVVDAKAPQEATVAANAPSDRSDGGSIRITLNGKNKSVAFAEAVDVRTFVTGSDSDTPSGTKDTTATPVTPSDTSPEDDKVLTTTSLNDRSSESVMVSPEILGAANVLSGIKLTECAERFDGPAPSVINAGKSDQLFARDVVHTELEISDATVLDSKFGTINLDCRDCPRPRLCYASMQDQFDKIEAIVLNGLSHGDMTELFATNFLISLTMRFYAEWINITKNSKLWEIVRSTEAVRLDMDLIKWIYRVLWHATTADTFWDATGVLRERRDKAWGSRQNRRDSIDSNATEPETLIDEDPTSNATSIPIFKDGIGEEEREKQWALKNSWIEWVRETGLCEQYSAEDIHEQRTVWLMLVTRYSDVSRYGSHHTYKGGFGFVDGDDGVGKGDAGKNEAGKNDVGKNHAAKNDAGSIDNEDNNNEDNKDQPNGTTEDKDSHSRHDSGANTDSEDDVVLVVTEANYRTGRMGWDGTSSASM
ncbi:hypothetical protein FKW77_005133 [Venturia effusa]|uniref:Uncharacterized protein n=1 Tax=Venturia effusa TaxID=50376 RepID=A0A517L7B6_9PEZI|nr:hypothetical protein FKW77_005133 [Venturia effusa]